jgi:hypothetical protein
MHLCEQEMIHLSEESLDEMFELDIRTSSILNEEDTLVTDSTQDILCQNPETIPCPLLMRA